MSALPVPVAGGESRLMTIAPVIQHSGVHFAALGLPGMLNGGGAVTACSLAPADAWRRGGLEDRCAFATC